MTHGAPDNYQVKPKLTTYTLQDMAELAERIGAIHSIDRLGDVIFNENFKDGICHWNTETGGLGETIEECGNRSEQGGFSLKILIPANDDAYAEIYRAMPYPIEGKIGFEFCNTTNAYMKNITAWLLFYTGSIKIVFGIKFDITNENIYYWNEGDDWVLLDENVKILWTWYLFHRQKFIVDLLALEYVRHRTSTKTTNMSGKYPHTINDDSKPHIYIELYINGNADGIIETYLDNIIITQNEP